MAVKQRNHEVPQKATEGVKNNSSVAGNIEVLYFTDPLCCWSWAFEPHWRKLLEEFKGRIRWRYCMGGLIPDWRNYSDAINSVTRPIQLGPVWMQAGQVGGVPIYHRLWMENPPASSYPACIAVKCAELQSPEAADSYLSFLRKACMLQGANIAKKEILINVAQDMVAAHPGIIKMRRFIRDLNSGNGIESFRKDLQAAQYHHITRFPALIIRSNGHPPVLLTGYVPYEVLLNSVTKYLAQDT